MLLNNASSLAIPWLKLSVIFLFVGYGTKMGLAPMHTWLPDAHSEAPSPVSALLSGALLNCFNQCGVIGKPQVIIAAEGEIILAIHPDMRSLRAFQDAATTQQSLLLAQRQRFGKM